MFGNKEKKYGCRKRVVKKMIDVGLSVYIKVGIFCCWLVLKGVFCGGF